MAARFFLNVPIGVVLLPAALRSLPDPEDSIQPPQQAALPGSR